MRRIIAVLALIATASLGAYAAEPYRLIKEIPVGGEGGWDYITVNGVDSTVTIAHLDRPGHLTVVQTLRTLVSGRTMILDAVTHDIFIPAAATTPNPSGRGRAVPVPGTFKILMYWMP